MADQIVSWGGFNSKGTSGLGITGSLSVIGSNGATASFGGDQNNSGTSTINIYGTNGLTRAGFISATAVGSFQNNITNLGMSWFDGSSTIFTDNYISFNARKTIINFASLTDNPLIYSPTNNANTSLQFTNGGTTTKGAAIFAIAGGSFATTSRLDFAISNAQNPVVTTSDVAMSLFNSKNFAIGTTTDSARLTVKGSGATSSTTALLVQNSNASASFSVRDDGLVTVGGNIALPVSSYVYWGDANSSIQHTGAATNFRTYQDNQPWSFITANNSTVQASINSGQVRARTLFSSTGNSPVTMSGWDGGGGTAGNTLLVKGGNSGVNAVYTGGNAGDLILENGLATDNSSGNGGTPGSIIFKYGTYNNTASVEYGRLNSSGNFLIGTTAGSAKLLISGSSNSALLEIDSPAVNNILYVSGSGNVGIGTGTPIAPLTVYNGTNAHLLLDTANTIDQAALITFRQNSPNWPSTIGTHVSAGGGNYGLQIKSGGVLNMVTNTSGNNFFGSVFTIPTARIHILGSGTTSATTALLVQNANASSSLSVKDGISESSTNTGKFQVIAGNWTETTPYTPSIWRTGSFASVKDIIIGSDGVLNGSSSRLNFLNYYNNQGQGAATNFSGYLRTSIGQYRPGGTGQYSGRGTLILGIYDTDYDTTLLNSFDVVSVGKYETTISGSLTVSSILTLTPQSPLPSGVPTGSFAVSSSAPPKPYFYDGTTWNALY